jgi:hypothetical protein
MICKRVNTPQKKTNQHGILFLKKGKPLPISRVYNRNYASFFRRTGYLPPLIEGTSGSYGDIEKQINKSFGEKNNKTISVEFMKCNCVRLIEQYFKNSKKNGTGVRERFTDFSNGVAGLNKSDLEDYTKSVGRMRCISLDCKIWSDFEDETYPKHFGEAIRIVTTELTNQEKRYKSNYGARYDKDMFLFYSQTIDMCGFEVYKNIHCSKPAVMQISDSIFGKRCDRCCHKS